MWHRNEVLTAIRRYLPDVIVYGQGNIKDKSMEEKPPTPGLKYRHYSPNAYVVLLDPAAIVEERAAKSMSEELHLRLRQALKDNQSIGLIHSYNEITIPEDLQVRSRYINDVSGLKGKESSSADDGEADHIDDKSLLIYPVAINVDKTGEDGQERFAAEVARYLFKALRGLDARGVDIIFVEVTYLNVA